MSQYNCRRSIVMSLCTVVSLPKFGKGPIVYGCCYGGSLALSLAEYSSQTHLYASACVAPSQMVGSVLSVRCKYQSDHYRKGDEARAMSNLPWPTIILSTSGIIGSFQEQAVKGMPSDLCICFQAPADTLR